MRARRDGGSDYAFEGPKRVLSLPAYPISFTEDPTGLKESMLRRGRKFESLRGYRFLSYEGTKVLMGEEAEERPVSTGSTSSPSRNGSLLMRQGQVSSRVMVHAYAYYRSNNIVAPTLQPFGSRSGTIGQAKIDTHAEGDDDNGSGSDTESYEGDDGAVPRGDVTSPRSKPANTGRTEHLEPLSDEQCLLATPWVIGLDLKSKEWSKLDF